jgi:hypothetical protein
MPQWQAWKPVPWKNFVRMYVIDGLADAVARGDFGQHGVTDMTAHREIVTQWKACFVLPGTFEPDQS